MSSDKKQIVICGNYGIGNLGDEAILSGLIRLVKSTWPNSEVAVMSSRPAMTAREHGARAVYRFPAGIRSLLAFIFLGRFWRTIVAVRRSDLILLGGGGLFSDEKWQAVLIWWWQAFNIWLLRRNFVCIAQSVGPLRRSWARHLTAWVFKKSRLNTVRDKKSAAILEGLGIKNVVELTDAAFALGYENEKAVRSLNQVILSLRKWGSENFEDLLREMVEVVDWLWDKHQLEVAFMPFQIEGDHDESLYEEIKKAVRNPGRIRMHAIADYRQAMEVIGRSRMVIGMRLHSIIFSVLETRPFVAISYSEKVRNLLEKLEFGDLYLEMKELRAGDLKGKIEMILAEEQSFIDRINKQKMKQTYLFFEHEKWLKDLL